jgi:hypothetical protein
MALPNAVTYTRDLRDSGDPISQERPLAISDKIYLNDPNENKALGWVLRQGVRNPVDEETFGHLEDAPFPNWVEYQGSDESSQATTGLIITDGSIRIPQYGRVYFPDIDEIIHFPNAFASDGKTSGGVTRNFGRGNASTSLLKQGMKGFVLPPAHVEGFTMGEGISNSKVYKSFATGVVSWPVRLTNTVRATRHRGGDPFIAALNKAWKQSKDQMEAELILGAKVTDSSTYSTPLHTSEGLFNYISTNVYTVDGFMTRQDLWDMLAEWTMINKKGGAIFCSKLFRHMVTNWAMQKTYYEQDTEKDGMTIQKVVTPDGDFDLIEVDLFNQHPTLAGYFFGVPLGQIEYRPLIGNIDLDIHYLPVNRDETAVQEGQIYGEYGWEFFQEEMFLACTGLEY